MISIAMATYNGEKFLSEQIDSILNQTYQDFEIIICDDCSKDRSPDILKEYQSKDSRIKVFFNENNLGFKKNFEKALSFCQGDYIAFCDQDDVWKKDKLQKSLDCIKDKMLISTDSLLVDSKLNSLGRTFKENLGIKSLPLEHKTLLKNLIHHSFIQGTTILCSASFIKRHLPLPDDCIYHDLYFGICAVIEDSYNYLDEPTLLYRQHENNVIGNKKKSKFSFLIPGEYNREKIIAKSKERIYLINLEMKSSSDSELKKYLLESKKYYEGLADKKFYTLHYLHKYYSYLQWDYSPLNKMLTLIKRFLGILIYKLFLQWNYKK